MGTLNASVFQENSSYKEKPAESSLKNRIFRYGKRFSTFHYALKLMNEKRVETETSHNEECNCKEDVCSIPIWGGGAQKNNAYVGILDIDLIAIQRLSSLCLAYQDHINFVTSDSVEFLASFNKSIDFLYLDSYNFPNPLPSQEHHLKETVAAYPYLHKNSIIMIDDCDLPFEGKGKLLVQCLLDRGWKAVIFAYQVF